MGRGGTRLIHKIEGSSNVDTIDYDPTEKLLKVVYKGGGEYWYQPVTATQHTLLMNSNSKGSYLALNITKNKNILTTKKSSGGGTQATIVKKHAEKTDNSLNMPEASPDDLIQLSMNFHQIMKE